MKKKGLLFTVLGLALCGAASGQQVADVLRFSQYNYGFGTARTAAMGGAFTSLGADLSSASINPAGFGMYRRSEFSISPALSITNMTSDYSNITGPAGNQIQIKYNSTDNRTRMSLNNLGMALNVYRGTGVLSGVTLGFTYNKLADFNSRQKVYGATEFSLSEIFAIQVDGIKQSALSGSTDAYKAFRSYTLPYWGAILAYQSGFINPLNGSTDGNITQYEPSIMMGAGNINQLLLGDTKGSIGEYGISVGFNISESLYFGASLGMQDIYYRDNKTYREYTENNIYELKQMNYRESLKMDGSAVNFKVGLIARPFDFWRIGIAFHTPTFINIHEEYQAFMGTLFDNNDFSNIDSPISPDSYTMQTPARFLVGTSLTIADVAILSADYERVWYNKMKMEHEDYDLSSLIAEDISRVGIKPANNFRLGAEVMFTPNMFLRTGYAYYGSMYKNNRSLGRTENISFGFGYRTGRFSLDLAYVYMESKNNQLVYNNPFIDNYEEESVLGTIDNKVVKNNIVLSFGLRF